MVSKPRRHGRQPDPAAWPARDVLHRDAEDSGTTAAEVLAAAAHIQMKVRVVVGDLAIEKPIRDANLGPVKVVTADGDPK
jgi:hypothetical protein